MVALKHLNVAGNKIRVLPDAVFALHGLVELDVYAFGIAVSKFSGAGKVCRDRAGDLPEWGKGTGGEGRRNV